MRVAVVTLFPEMFSALTDYGITGRAVKNELLSLSFSNPRDYATDKHKTVDDKPYGGGPGMVMAVPPLRAAITEAKTTVGAAAKVVYMSPQGKPLTQAIVERLLQEPSLVLLCGRYEGIDERVIQADVDEEISLGDFVISGGELAAMTLLDALIRLLPDALGDASSAAQDSFAGRGLLDCPHYTRPEQVDGQQVPSVLLSGNHRNIERWRLKQMLHRTQQRRPELLKEIELTKADQALLAELLSDKS